MDAYQILSTISDYPRADFKSSLKSGIDQMKDQYPEASKLLLGFEDYVNKQDLDELEEIYTRTFDIKGLCCLDIGYVLFGEDYKRGEFLVNIQRLQKENNVETGVELPDHLTNFLKLMSVINEDDKKELSEKILLPALEKMLSNFQNELTANNFYSNVLRAIESVFKTEYTIDRTIFGGPVC